MLHTRWIKIIREVWQRKTRTLLVATSIFIGVMGVITLFSLGDIVIKALQDAVDQDHLAMQRAYITTSDPDTNDTAAFLNELHDLPGVEHLQAVAHYPFYWKHPGDDQFEEGVVFGFSDPLTDLPLQPIELVNGRWPEAGQHEIVVERRFASAHGFTAGDTITVRRLNDSVSAKNDSSAATWTIVGTVFEPYSYPLLPGGSVQIPADMMIFALLEDVKTISSVAGFNLIEVRYTDFATAEANARELEITLTEVSSYVPTITLLEDPAKNYLIEQTNTFDSVLTLLAIVSLVVSGFLVLNVINAMVIEQRRSIGVMKSLGANGWDNLVMYAGIALVYGVIGVIPGVALGIPMGFSASETIAPEFNIFLDSFTTSPQAIAIGVTLGLLVPVLAAIGPVLMGIRVTILEAITDFGIDATYGRGPLARLIDGLPLPTPMKQALRNTSQKKGRLALTITTLALAAGAFMGVYSTFSSFDQLVDNSLGQIGVDVSLHPRGSDDYDTISALIRDNVEGISSIEPGTSLNISIDGHKTRQMGNNPAFLIAVGINPANPEIVHFRLRSGTAWNNDPYRQGVVISSGLADNMRLTSGDTITIHIGAKKQTFAIIGVSRYPFDTLWMRWDELARLGGLTRGAPVPNEYVTMASVDGVPTAAAGINLAARSVLPLTDGDFITPGEPGVIVTTALAEMRGYQIGDYITITSGDETRDVPITGTFDIPPALMPANSPATDQVIALFWEDLARLEGLPLDGEPVPSSLDIVLDQRDPSAKEVRAAIDRINAVLLDHGINSSYTNWVLSKTGLTQQLDVAQTILNTAAALIAAVGAIGLLSALSMAVFERQKEIGVMRSVGATSYTVAFQFLVEGLIVGVIAWVLAIPFSYALDRSLIVQFQFEGAEGTGYTPMAMVFGLVGTLVIAILASLWPSIAAARKTVSDILRYQ